MKKTTTGYHTGSASASRYKRGRRQSHKRTLYISMHSLGVYPAASKRPIKPPVEEPAMRSTWERRKDGYAASNRARRTAVRTPRTPPPSKLKIRKLFLEAYTGLDHGSTWFRTLLQAATTNGKHRLVPTADRCGGTQVEVARCTGTDAFIGRPDATTCFRYIKNRVYYGWTGGGSKLEAQRHPTEGV